MLEAVAAELTERFNHLSSQVEEYDLDLSQEQRTSYEALKAAAEQGPEGIQAFRMSKFEADLDALEPDVSYLADQAREQ